MLQSDFQFDLQKILEGDNIGIAATGITIVFVALLLITIAIALLPKVLRSLEGILPAEVEDHAAPGATPEGNKASGTALVAAIGMALHRERTSKNESRR